jgi:hypothetical protein
MGNNGKPEVGGGVQVPTGPLMLWTWMQVSTWKGGTSRETALSLAAKYVSNVPKLEPGSVGLGRICNAQERRLALLQRLTMPCFLAAVNLMTGGRLWSTGRREKGGVS